MKNKREKTKHKTLLYIALVLTALLLFSFIAKFYSSLHIPEEIKNLTKIS